ncbi:2215_t:CDS:2 [Diversispora eburnea]|uniref:2215_t:CDS:1 n=1 Tax=Diversispora eburnea TaxID=1213867 RepID=A0A9N8VC57_9GLOM|nr:2215_t:CDS:2 [Diversispora eburnea]
MNKKQQIRMSIFPEPQENEEDIQDDIQYPNGDLIDFTEYNKNKYAKIY